jgi:coenzyme PQQ precursor peptide PqqA
VKGIGWFAVLARLLVRERRQVRTPLRNQSKQHGFSLWLRCTRLYEGLPMIWTTPQLIEITVGLEINGYLPAEF